MIQKTLLIYLTLFLFVAATAQAKDLISITGVGDVMMGSTYPTNGIPANDGVDLFKPALQWLEASDIRFANFEGTFFEGEPQPDGKQPGPNRFLFQTPIRMVDRLVEAKFNVVSLANNHIIDFGSAGARSTKETLQKAQIQYSSKSGEVASFKVDETEVKLLAVDFYSGARSMTHPNSTYLEIKKLKDNKALVIVSAHVGAEGQGAEKVVFGPELYLGENRGDSVSFAKSAIDAGADLIIMHGPHVPRGIQVYKNKLIVYSLGNFMTASGIIVSGMAGLAPLIRVQMDKNGNFKAGQVVSFIQLSHPHRIELDRKQNAYQLMRALSLEQFPDSLIQFEDNGIFKLKTD